MSLLASEAAHAAAVLAVINAALPGDTNAYTADEVPSSPRPANYVEVSIMRRANGTQRHGSGSTAAGWRILTREVSQTAVSNAQTVAEFVRVSLERKRISVTKNAETKTSTPIQFETGEPVGEDDGWWSGYQTWTYVL